MVHPVTAMYNFGLQFLKLSKKVISKAVKHKTGLIEHTNLSFYAFFSDKACSHDLIMIIVNLQKFSLQKFSLQSVLIVKYYHLFRFISRCNHFEEQWT